MRQLQSLNPATALAQNVLVLQQLTAAHTNDWVLLDQLGKALVESGDRAGASIAWSNVVQQIPSGFMGHYQLGLLLNQPDTVHTALTHLEKARELRPFVPEVNAALGTAYTLLKRFQDADTAFQRALDVDANHEPTHLAWANSYAARQQWRAARTHLEQLVAADTNSLAGHWHLAQLLAEQGELSAATNHYREVLRLHPRNEAALRFFSGADQPARSPQRAQVQ
jgi:tetratricopeptide (TPR) repeat protein